jgi:two-component system cell cycle response regulator DivK
MTTRRVLVVEDERDNMDLFVQILRFHGCEVLKACDGREAINLTQQEIPDLILMDLSLPALDGWEATRAIKDIPEVSHIPVVALTAHAMVGDKERALEAGCDGYISKPIEVTSFYDEVCAYLKEPCPESLPPRSTR